MSGPSNRTVALSVVGAVAGMIGLAYAAVPLYFAFCRATGYGGTTQVATSAPADQGTRRFAVRFDTNVGSGLPWTFAPEISEVNVRAGETKTVFFKVRNDSGRAITANAVYNVSPDISGAYFDKISCFCFSEQTLGPGETMEMPVVFFLDRALEKDESMNGVEAITLSYTFYPVKATRAASAAPPAKKL